MARAATLSAKVRNGAAKQPGTEEAAKGFFIAQKPIVTGDEEDEVDDSFLALTLKLMYEKVTTLLSLGEKRSPQGGSPHSKPKTWKQRK